MHRHIAQKNSSLRLDYSRATRPATHSEEALGTASLVLVYLVFLEVPGRIALKTQANEEFTHCIAGNPQLRRRIWYCQPPCGDRGTHHSFPFWLLPALGLLLPCFPVVSSSSPRQLTCLGFS